MSDFVITLNAGSSSIKAAIYAVKNDALQEAPVYRAHVSGIGGACAFETVSPTHGGEHVALGEGVDHGAAWAKVLESLGDALRNEGADESRVVGVGHRIVHGGAQFFAPEVLKKDSLAILEEFVPLAPGHQPYNLAGVAEAETVWPGVMQVGCFDTAFHRTQPAVAQEFALPRAYADDGVLRYGFHGLSYAYIAEAAPEIIGPAAQGKLIVAHLGAGASLCALAGGKSLATTMGFTALDGLPMATRSGDIDPGVILHLMTDRGMTAQEISHLLYKESGLLGMSGVSGDMRVLLASEEASAKHAIDYFVYRCVREIGALTSVIGGVDAIVFTAGIGEHSSEIRARVLDGLEWLGVDCDLERNENHGPEISTATSAVSAWVIPTNEELMIARAVIRKAGGAA